MAKREVRIKNATKVDCNCQPIPSIPEWRKTHPEDIYFDSTLECYTWKQLSNVGIESYIKPVKIQLVPAYDTWTFDLPKNIRSEKSQQQKVLKQKVEEQTHLNSVAKKKLFTKWKGELTREFNKLYSKELVPERSKEATWEPDFLLPAYNTFLECKGGQGNDAWRNTLKLGRWMAYRAGYNVVIVKTQQEVNSFISYLIHNGMEDPRSNETIKIQILKHELMKL